MSDDTDEWIKGWNACLRAHRTAPRMKRNAHGKLVLGMGGRHAQYNKPVPTGSSAAFVSGWGYCSREYSQ